MKKQGKKHLPLYLKPIKCHIKKLSLITEPSPEIQHSIERYFKKDLTSR